MAMGYLVLLNGKVAATPNDWVLTAVSTLLIVRQGQWPLAITLLQTFLFAVAPGGTLGAGVANMAGFFALGELTWRRSGWQVWVGTAAVLSANVLTPPFDGVAPMLFRAILLIGLPVLVGLHLRSVQEIAWQAKERAAADAQAARADERTAIARELHDLVAHHVASMVLRIGAARHALDPDPEVAVVLKEVHESGIAAMADLRTLVTVLRDTEGGQEAVTDLPSALRATVDRIEAAGPRVTAHIDTNVADLEGVLRLAVLRVVQEGLTNVLKHVGERAKVTLLVCKKSDAVEVTLSDDGQAVPAEPGHGLIGMRERVELVGGQLTTGPTGRGWLVHARMPA
ncbi:signal transduction histidine kinase [Actinocrispum wychmicini]|uniref:histidine kinase n=2 Tax=Actinocrispum wychmicini TaxID=1213861 RepID=A0A4R2JWZ2_9PSEU|nr:signal transduction histidine kinase [Actinocrispum wychmicini]